MKTLSMDMNRQKALGLVGGGCGGDSRNKRDIKRGRNLCRWNAPTWAGKNLPSAVLRGAGARGRKSLGIDTHEHDRERPRERETQQRPGGS